MTKQVFLILSVVIITLKGYAQQDNVWAFGKYALLDFNSIQNGYPMPGVQAMETLEGAASVCDSNGKLLFYTNGSTVFNRNHDTMLNGDIFPEDRTSSSSQGALIIPMQGEQQYYVFSLTESAYQENDYYSSLYYSIVDMSLDGGFGGIVSGKKAVYIDTGFSEQLTSVPGLYGDVWVLTSRHDQSNSLTDTMYSIWAYNVTAQNGLNTVPVVTSGLPNRFHYIGSLMVSPDYTMLADTRMGAVIYQFDRRVGKPHSPIVMPGLDRFDSMGRGNRYYGAAAFSPNNRYLYLARGNGGVFQFDLSHYHIDSIFHSREKLLERGYDLKLGSEGKIYVIDQVGGSNLSVITQPDEKGVNARPLASAFALASGTTSVLNFSNIIHMPGLYEVGNSIFDTCIVKWPHLLSPTQNDGEFVEWSNGDTTETIAIEEPGIYWVMYVRGRYYHVDSFFVGDYNKRVNIESEPERSDCFGHYSGRASVSIDGMSNADFESFWIRSDGDTISRAKRVDGLPSGDYQLIILQQHCTNVFTINIGETSSDAFFSFDLVTEPACGTDSSGSAYLDVADDSTYHYQTRWSLANGIVLENDSDTIKRLPAGDYELYIQTEKCDTVLTFSIERIDDIVDFELKDSIWCQGLSYTVHNLSGSHYERFFWIGNGDTLSTDCNLETYITQSGAYEITLLGIGKSCTMYTSQQVLVDSAYQNVFSTKRGQICLGEAIEFFMTPRPEQTKYYWQIDGIFYRESTPRQNMQLALDESGAHTIQLTTRFRACPDTSFTDTIQIRPLPLVSLGTDSVMCIGRSPIMLQNLYESDEEYKYKWNTGSEAKRITVTHPGYYALTVSDRVGCSNTEWVMVSKDCYIDIPNAFTPNGDGANDYFFPRQLLSSGLRAFSMQVFNRWGQLVFASDNPQGRGWDGRFNGREQPEGVYVYIIDVEFASGKVEKYEGNVTLLR